jgi:hypothetical protein
MDDAVFYFSYMIVGVASIILGRAIYQSGSKRTYGYPTCLQCRHNLTGILGRSDQCPECGSVIKDGEFRGAYVMRPSGWLVHALGVVIFLWACVMTVFLLFLFILKLLGE